MVKVLRELKMKGFSISCFSLFFFFFGGLEMLLLGLSTKIMD